MRASLSIYGWLILGICCSFQGDEHWTDPLANSWITLTQEQTAGVDFALKIKQFPNIGEQSWISFEVLNSNDASFEITHAFYEIELTAYDKYGKIVKEGFIDSSDPAEIFELPESINPFGLPEIPIEKLKESDRLSALCSSILGIPTNDKLRISGRVNFFLEFKNERKYQIRVNNYDLNFFWWAPRKAQATALLANLRSELKKPIIGSTATQRLLTKLEMPDIHKHLEVSELLHAINLRSGLKDGRPAIADFLNKYHGDHPLTIQYYQTALENRDFRIIEDLTNNMNLFHEQFRDELLASIPSASSATKFQLLKLVHEYAHINLTENITASLSAHIQQEYGDLLRAVPRKLSKRKLITWATAVEMWSYTHDERALRFIRPFLTSNVKLLEDELMLDLNSCSVPRATRIDEIALEAILRIQGIDLERRYQDLGFAPPYADGSGADRIAEIRRLEIKRIMSERMMP